MVELDAQVQQNVFGNETVLLHCRRDPEHGGLYVCPFCSPEYHSDEQDAKDGALLCAGTEAERQPCYQPHGGNFSEVVPAYSEDIRHAWKIVDHLRAQPWYRGVDLTDAGTHGGAWTCRIYGKHKEGVIDLFQVWTEPTPALALCRAAIGAMEAVALAHDDRYEG